MPITNVKINMNEYKRLVEEDSKRAAKDSVYGKLLSDLSNLCELTKEYFTLDKDGNAPILSEQDYNKLIDEYSKVAKSCNEFLSANHGKNRLEKKRVNMITQLNRCVGKDLTELTGRDRTKEASLSDVVQQARVRKVDLTGENLGSVGASISSRIPLQTAQGKKGFFTKAETFSYYKAVEQLFEKIKDDFPEPYKSALEQAKNNEKMIGELAEGARMSETAQKDMNSPDPRIKKTAYNNIAMTMTALFQDKSTKDVLKDFNDNPKLLDSAAKMVGGLSKIEYTRIAHLEAGIKDGARADQRNSCMSDIASLMGMSKLLAKAVPMQIIHNGQEYNGTFMETAAGEDLSRMTKDSMLLKADTNSFNHPAGLKQIADMQVLDYICGNIDRHAGNIMYHFEKGENGNVLLAGITGIDNDCSFGVKSFEKHDRGDKIKLTTLDNIKAVTQSAYETIQNLSIDAVKVMLQDRLTPEEVDAVGTRISLLKEGIEKGSIKAVPDHQWGKENYTIQKLAQNKEGIFFVAESVPKIVKNRQKQMDLNEIGANETSIKYAKGNDVTDRLENRFRNINDRMNDFVSKAGQLKGSFHKDSKEFKNMLLALKEVKEYGKAIEEKLKNGGTIDQETFKNFTEKTVDLGIASQQYMNAKNLSQFTELGQNRFAFAAQMRDFAQENFAIKEMPVIEEVKMARPSEPMMM